MNAKIIIGELEITAEKSSDCYITDKKPDFPEVLGEVSIEWEDGSALYENAQLVECASIDDRYWFAFIEESPYDRTIRELREENSILEGAIVELAEIIGGME